MKAPQNATEYFDRITAAAPEDRFDVAEQLLALYTGEDKVFLEGDTADFIFGLMDDTPQENPDGARSTSN